VSDRIDPGDSSAEVVAARRGVSVFTLEGDAFGRGVVEVTGGDASRWLDGMVTNDIAAISRAEGAGDRAENGCYAALLTPKGRIVSDLHILAREDGYWLETSAFAVADLMARLDKYIVADDVELADRSAEFARLAVEGPGATRLLAGVSGLEPVDNGGLEAVPEGSWTVGSIAETEVEMARFGFTGEDAWQLFVPPAARPAVLVALADAGARRASMQALEILRVEAGVPRLGPELNEEVFPDEARLEAAISRTKGCYKGQEIVARLYSRGAVNHLLVGLRFDGGRIPALGATLFCGAKKSGQVTSAAWSPTAGPIGLGYVRREHAEAGTELRCEDREGDLSVTVAESPVVAVAPSSKPA
jgi:folate-binding protein YgfZ